MSPVLHLFKLTTTPNSLKIVVLLFISILLPFPEWHRIGIIQATMHSFQIDFFHLPTDKFLFLFSCGMITYVCVLSHSVLSNSVRPYGLQPARFLCPWNSSDKRTGVGCHALLQKIFLTQVLNWGLLHLLHQQAGSLPLAPPGLLTIHCINILKLVKRMCILLLLDGIYTISVNHIQLIDGAKSTVLLLMSCLLYISITGRRLLKSCIIIEDFFMPPSV